VNATPKRLLAKSVMVSASIAFTLHLAKVKFVATPTQETTIPAKIALLAAEIALDVCRAVGLSCKMEVAKTKSAMGRLAHSTSIASTACAKGVIAAIAKADTQGAPVVMAHLEIVRTYPHRTLGLQHRPPPPPPL
jgi:hypothetical protein